MQKFKSNFNQLKFKRKPKAIFSKFKHKVIKSLRFKRLFKQFFIYQKKKNFFLKINSLFNSKRILKHQFKFLFNISYKLLLSNISFKNSTSLHFFDFWLILERSISIILIRIKFIIKVNIIKESLKLKLIAVNGNIINQSKYLLSPFDLIQKCKFKKKSSIIRCKLYYWRNTRWKKVSYMIKKFYSKRYINYYRASKISIFLNYLEINYKGNSAILLRNPIYQELFFNFNPKSYSVFHYKFLYYCM